MSSFDSERSSTEVTDIFPPESNDELVVSISKILMRLIEHNKKLEDYQKIVKSQSKLPFSSNAIPHIKIDEYLARIIFYAKPEESTLITSLIYIDKICEYGRIMVTEYNIHRILFSSILVSIKFNEDQFYNLQYYSQIAGVCENELIMLEIEFLKMIDFKLFITQEEYQQYCKYLKSKPQES